MLGKIDLEKLKFEKAEYSEHNEILALYRSVLGTEFCTWNNEYPSELEIEGDIDAQTLYLLKKENKIIGAISIVPENELDELPVWKCKSAREFARVAVLPEYQGHCLSCIMVSEIERILNKTAIHILAAKKNIPALKIYTKMNYEIRGEVSMYGNEYYAMEKVP